MNNLRVCNLRLVISNDSDYHFGFVVDRFLHVTFYVRQHTQNLPPFDKVFISPLDADFLVSCNDKHFVQRVKQLCLCAEIDYLNDDEPFN